jgi:hypothetical protein
MGALREAADALGTQYEEKWWRPGRDWSRIRVEEIVRGASRGAGTDPR